MYDLLVYIPRPCPRLSYTCKVLMEEFAMIKVGFEIDARLINQYKLEIVQSNTSFTYDNTLFFDSNRSNFLAFDWKSLLASNYAFNTDWLGACFFLLSRMEEYSSEVLDHHGRFPWQSSVAYKFGFLNLPLVDDLAKRFLTAFWPQKPIIPLGVKVLPTLDIDMSHAYKGRPFWRLIPALCKAALNGSLKERVMVLLGKTQDPYDNFDYQLALLQELGLKAQYFIQVGGYSKYDKNLSVNHFLMKQLLQKLVGHHAIGLHPSYFHLENPRKLRKEHAKLSNAIGHFVSSVRFHFLRFHVSDTYPLLVQQGIREEHSMGYAETIGFRASTSRPFAWFDLKQNKQTDLIVVPFCAMDVALEHYMRLSPAEAMAEITSLKSIVNLYGGCFSICFHNESLCEKGQWLGWRAVFEHALGKTGGNK